MSLLCEINFGAVLWCLMRMPLGALCAVPCACVALAPPERPENAGQFRVLYPNSVQVFAEGRLLRGAQVGLWRYYYPSGELLLLGSFSDAGLADGVWRCFTLSGSISYRMLEYETEEGDYMYCPVVSDIRISLPPERLQRMLNYVPSGWCGTGTYVDGSRVGGI